MRFIENTDSNLPKRLIATFLRSNRLFCFISIYKFGNFKNPFAMLTSLFELNFRFRRFILLVQTKKWSLWTTAAAQAAENHGDEWGLTWYLWQAIYRAILTWTHLQNSLAAAEALSLKISPVKHFSSDHEDHPNQHKNNHKPCDEMGHPIVNMMESQWKLRQQHDQNFPMEGKPLYNKY